MLKVLMNADTIGGVWTYTIELIAALARYDIEFVLCSTGRLPTAEQRQAVVDLENARLLESGFKLEWMDDPWDDVAKTRQWLQEVAAAENPDILHLNDYSHAAANWSMPVLVVGHSCVLSWHAAVRHAPADDRWATYRDAVKAGLQKADTVVAPSSAMLEALRAHYGPLKRSGVIYNGLRRSTGLRRFQKQRQVLTAGRLWDEAKNVSTVIRAAGEIDAPVLLAGDAICPSGRDAAMSNITCLGRLTPQALATQYADAAIYALPARYEPFGYTPLEAAMQGCALVLGDIPSLREIWGDAALFVPPDDEQALAGTVNHLLKHPALLNRQAVAAQAQAQHYSPDRMAAGYLSLYQQLAMNANSADHQWSESCVL